MPNQPAPPLSLPKYIRDGVPKQDNDTLRALQEWIDELVEYREDISEDDIEIGEDEEVQEVQETSSGTVVIKKVSCGKDGCKCNRGELHGPYKYVVTRQGDTLKWDYEGPVQQ